MTTPARTKPLPPPARACLALLCATALVPGCAGPAPAPGAEAARAAAGPQAMPAAAAALQGYAALLRRQDSAAIAQRFTPEGTLVNAGQPAITGREAIRHFLDSFSNYKVLSAEMTVLSARATTGAGVERVVQTGRYAQSVRAPDGQQLHAGGWFTAQWLRQPSGAWLLERMATSPTPP